MLGFVNDLGRMNAITSANVQLFAMNAFASEDCLPNGGFPNTKMGAVAAAVAAFVAGDHSK